MKSKEITRLTTAAMLILFLLTLGVSASAAATTAPNGGQIEGNVTSPGGFPLEPGTLVKLFEPDLKTVRGISTPNPDSGEFEFGFVSNGLYVIKAVPPEGSIYTQSLPHAFSVVNAPVNVGAIALSEPQVSGTVLAPDGVTLAESDVFVYLGDGQVLQHIPADSGNFKIGGLPVGGYSLRAFPRGEEPFWKSAKLDLNITSPETELEADLFLRPADLWGYILDDQGNPIREARVTASKEGQPQEHDLSNLSGFWAIGGLDPGEYKITVLPPWLNSGLIPPEPQLVRIPSTENPYTLVFLSPPKLVQGVVATNSGVPVSHAEVLARRVNLPGNSQAISAADGTYQLELAPGLWALTVKPTAHSIPEDWVFALPPQLVFFHHNNDPENRALDFTVKIADSQVIGTVQMPDSSSPPFTVTVALHNDEGIGRAAQIDPLDGTFEIDLPNGNYKVAVHAADPGYLGPAVEPVSLPVADTLDLGVLNLLPRDAVISGTLTADGLPVSGIPIAGWRAGVPGLLQTTSGPNGEYSLAVSAGQWHVQAAPGADQPYLYDGSGEDVELPAGGLVTGIDFSLLPTDASILGHLVDESGQPLTEAFGWASAVQQGQPQIHNGAPIENGSFIIHIPAGVYKVAAFMPAGSPFLSGAEKQVAVGPGEQIEITLTIREQNARISGALWDPREDVVVAGVNGVVGAWSGSSWTATHINDGNGTYSLDAAEGLWHLNFRIDPNAGYTKLGGPWNIGLAEGRTAIVPLPITAKDGQIRGMVLDPNGDPLPGATVIAKGVHLLVHDLWLKTTSLPDGSFNMDVPHGRYRLAASGGEAGWIAPLEKLVDVPKNGVSEGHMLAFQVPDNSISGSLTISNANETGDALVWGWSAEGGYSHGRFPIAPEGSNSVGDYNLDVLSDMKWHVGAVFETSSQYWFGRAEVEVGGTPEMQDLLLKGPFPKPAPVVITFDASVPQQIQLADGTGIFIPAGAMPVEGMVTLRIVPVATLPHQQHTNIYRYGYAFLAADAQGEPIESHFNQDVLISFAYDDNELNLMHIHERWLKPVYFSTTMDRWVFPESFSVDMESNRVVMQIDHFTDYALAAPQSASMVFLPITLK